MVRIAGLFPGQGSQTPDMREHVERTAPELLERCIAVTGEDPFARVSESTRFAQPAIFCASVAGWMRARPVRRASQPRSQAIPSVSSRRSSPRARSIGTRASSWLCAAAS